MAESISPDQPPYLTLTISQALSLPPPPAPEPKQHDSVNSMLDECARFMPDELAVGFTQLAADGTWTCRTLTYAQVSSLAVGLAGEVSARLPGRKPNRKSPNETPLVAVLSPSGLDLFAHIVALWRLGFGVLCIAPGSPAESIANLLRLTETTVVLAHASQLDSARAAVDAARAGGSGNAIQASVCELLPNVIDFIDRSVDSQTKTKGSAGPDDVLVTMHTSSSSGLPKPIYQLHRFWTASMLSAPSRALSAFTTTPLFHGGMSDLLRSIQAGSSIFFHPTADPGALSTSAICQAIAACTRPVSYFLSVPYILDMLFTDRSEVGRQMLESMQLVSTGGAPLPQQLGDDMVQRRIRLVSRLGSSECGFLMSSWRDFDADQEWNHLRIPDKLGQSMLRFEPHDPSAEGGLFELVVTKEWPTKLVANRDDGSYATSDLYAKHPSLPNTWRYDSRSDDTIVLVSGKKATAPVAEQKLKASPLVTEAIAFGANRAILGALVFVSPEAVPQGAAFDDTLKVKLLTQLQPVLAQINAASPPHAQLATEMLHLLPPSESANIPRASKGTLQRGRAYQHYAGLIDSIYVDFEEGRSLRLHSTTSNGAAAAAKETLSGQKLIEWLQGKVQEINGRKLSPDEDLFVAGVDSIQSARIRAAVHQNIELRGKLLERNVVYEYPTLRILAEHVEEVRGGGGGEGSGADERQQRELKLMRDLVEKYSQARSESAIDESALKTEKEGGKGTLYVLTGVTGGLGAQILDQVVAQCQQQDGVVCLVRADSVDHARQRVLDSLSSRHLDATHAVVNSPNSAVRALPVDLSRSDCGIPATHLSPLTGYSRVVTIHSAWSVNFVASLSSFEPENIAGLSHLISLHRRLVATTRAYTFCSSVASILGQRAKALDETLSTAPEDAVAMGYARSKWVVEQIVARRFASSQDGYRIVRIGQLCSDTLHGVWNESEAWPILTALSCQLGIFPDLHERLDWISTDVAAKSVLDISLSSTNARMYNVAQPTTASPAAPEWKDLFEWLQASNLALSLVDPQEWLDRLEKSNIDYRGLLPLWQRNFSKSPEPQQIVRFGCETALATSDAFRTWQTQGVTLPLIQKTVQRWKDIGFLS
ncbi:related to LYS2-L-aminoadipate-semialdehyde dehydrogenase, large subunit [Sporisorium reilianum f. sp. reilianum]|uniref:Related to LYS2-L-aminoadipate-semialdehyde dehydrogenase, large subunit n=1 Tax=Sporisorium reilianum f. sp. reilianum TaxID=72559 RepID=A0A2N8UCW3_9BASI|nr:related to LYS2-L-aminoadipate-semialdehyde dehydrogenase, large subunit [Sporisorium reilianum f. sp. reilianum]